MNELSITIHIAGRTYPLTVQATEEANIRNAGKFIQDRLQQYTQQFALKDQRDALAMFALEMANENRELREKLRSLESEVEEELDSISNLLSDVQP